MKRRIVFTIIFMLAAVFQLMAQDKISGKVIDQELNTPLVGVSVYEKGTTNGVITDFDGNYSITLINSDATIVFSYVGYSSVEMATAGKSSIDVSLVVDAADLDEVVIVGYGVQRKSHLTGAITKVRNESLDQIAVSQPSEALVGKVSGVTIQNTDGTAGSAPTIRVRGIGSIAGNASPLVVVDGVVADFSDVNMNDVESIEILKDAASAAIYGSRGGNGVIMITTKSGQAGETKVSFNGFVGTKFTEKYEDTFTSLDEWFTLVETNDTEGLATDRYNYIKELGTETDWVDVIFDGGIVQNYSLSIRGGSDKSKYYISGGYINDEGVLLTDSFKKINLRAKVDSRVNDRLTLGVNIAPTYSEKRDFPIGIHDAVRQSPWLPIWHDEHTIQYVDRSKYPDVQVGDYAMEYHFNNYDLYDNGSDVDISTTSNVNPYAKIVERDQRVYNFKINTNSYLMVNIMKGLDFKTSMALNYSTNQDSEWVGPEAHRNGSSAVESSYDVDVKTKYVNENILTYSNTFGNHDIDAVAGVAFEKWHNRYSDMSGSGYEFEYIRTLNAATEITTAETSETSETMHSVLSRLNYAYSSKYLVSLSARWDGSSRFGEEKRYGFFPAASLGWRLTEEDFLKGNDVLSNLKLTASYGLTGNKDGIDLYQYLSNLSPVTSVIDGSKTSGFNPENIANPNLGWEQSQELNLGLVTGFLDNRINLNVDLYQRTSKDLLLEQPMPGITGFETATVNIGEVQNSGIEVEVNSLIVNSSSFKYELSANASHNKNELTDYADASGEINYIDSKRPAEYIALVGEPISSMYGYVFEKEIPSEFLKNPYYPINATAQDCYVKDLNGDGIIDGDDRAILGSPYPKLTWGVTNSFKFNDFDFMFTFQGSHGAKVRNMDPQYINNQFNSNMDYNSDFQDGDMVVQKIYTDLFVQDASYVSLRTVNLGYTLPQEMASNVGINKLRFYVSGQNLLFFTADDYTSFNPEGVTEDDNPLTGGYQRGAAPTTKSVTFGVSLEF